MSLRDYHEAVREWAQHQERERRGQIRSLRTAAGIRERDARIRAAREARVDEAAQAMSAHWDQARHGLETCVGLTSGLRERWLVRFDRIRYSGKRATHAQLDEMAAEIRSFAARLPDCLDVLRRGLDTAAAAVECQAVRCRAFWEA